MRRRLVGLLLPLATTGLWRCSDDAAYVVVSIVVPSALEERLSLSTAATEIGVGGALESLNRTIELGSAQLDGFTFALAARAGVEKDLWLEIRGNVSVPLARGYSRVAFREKIGAATVTLKEACDVGADCDDGSFCNGNEYCDNGTCELGAEPCGSSFECVVSSCDELQEQCEITIDHGACGEGRSCSDRLGCVECYLLGAAYQCQVGEWCMEETDDSVFVRGQCYNCDIADHCGVDCRACLPGEECIDGGCSPCDEASRCGPDCLPCAEPTPVCGGFDVGCVIGDCTGEPDFTLCGVLTAPERSYDICTNGICVSPGAAIYTDGIDRSTVCFDGDAPSEWLCDTPHLGFAMPDTNQRSCFDDDYEMTCPPVGTCASTPHCGQDAQYGWDLAHNETERFTRTFPVPDEPVVVDNITSLTWQGCSDGQSGADCQSGESEGRTWETALSSCNDLIWGGYMDWHLPDIDELQSIVDYGGSQPPIDSEVFPATPTSNVWSSTSFGYLTSRAWVVNFFYGQMDLFPKDYPYRVRCVRGGPPPGGGAQRLNRTSDTQPVVTDSVTGLIWQGCPAGLSGSSCDNPPAGDPDRTFWAEALAFCEGLEWDGQTDWRLPNVKELRSIVDRRHYSPAVDLTAFPATPHAAFWSSSSQTAFPSWAWLVIFINGTVEGQGKDNWTAYLRCVRGGT